MASGGAEPRPSRWRSYRDVDAAGDPGSLGDQLDHIAAVPFLAAEKLRSLGLLEFARGASVLDVGCGTGSELAQLAELACGDASALNRVAVGAGSA